MLSIETEARLAKLFLNIADGEKAVETSRKVLGEQLDFDPYQTFKKLDTESKNYVDEFNIVEFLKVNSVYCSLEEARFVIFFYDSDSDGKLSYSEFLNLVLNESNFTLRRHGRENLSHNKTRLTLPFDVEYSLAKVFERELDLIRNLQIVLNDLKSRRDFNVYELYSSVQSYSDLSSDDIRKFLIRNGVDVEESDIRAIMKRLDLDRDMRISLYEFRKILTFSPLTVGKDLYSYNKTNLTGSRGTFYDGKTSTGKNVSTSPFRRFSPQRSNHFESPRSLGKTYTSPERRAEVHISPLRREDVHLSPLRREDVHLSPLRREEVHLSPLRREEDHLNQLRRVENYGSPLRRARSPLRSIVRSPLRRTLRSPLRSENTSYGYDRSAEVVKGYTDYRPSSYKYLSLEEETFIAYLKDLIDLENNLERAKCDLLLRTDFNIDDAFRLFELDGRGFLSEHDLKYGLNALDVFPTDAEINLLFKRFDLRNEGVVSFEDFFEVFSSVDREYRKTLENRLPSHYRLYLKNDVFSVLTHYGLKDFLSLLLKNEARIEGWRQRLDKMSRFNIREFFEKIDRTGKNYVSETDISNYLQRNDVVSVTKDAELIFFRMDKDGDGRISFVEFSDEVLPHSKEYFI